MVSYTYIGHYRPYLVSTVNRHISGDKETTAINEMNDTRILIRDLIKSSHTYAYEHCSHTHNVAMVEEDHSI